MFFMVDIFSFFQFRSDKKQDSEVMPHRQPRETPRMRLKQWIEHRFYALAERYCAVGRPAWPPVHKWRRCGVIAHRGAPAPDVPENTMAAYERALALGADGIELDVRWTDDGQPVVCHDPDLQRVFQLPHRIADLSLADLKTRCPLLPTLQEVVARFGRRHHLMVEFKPPPLVRPDMQNRRLADIFSGLQPVRDYHLMALNPELFDRLVFAPPRACLPIARTRVRQFSRLAAERRLGGLAGHYMLIGRAMIDRHQRSGRCIGTGFVDTPACLLREVARGVDWVFTDDAAAIHAQLIRRPDRRP